jgi:TonB family protein
LAACGGDEAIETPTPRFTDSPVEYPLELWDRNIEGSTLVRVLVNETGGVDSVMVMESSGHAGLDSAAVRGARSMEFEPATKDGEPLKVWASVPVRFSKDAKPAPPGPADDPGAGDPPSEAAANPNVTSGLGSANESGPEPGEAGSTGSRRAGSDRA